MVITTIVDTQTNEFVPGGHAEDARYIKIEVARNPDESLEKYSGNPADPFLAKTALEIADAADAKLSASATATSRQKDILTTVAAYLRRSNIAAWNAMSTPQKKAAVLAEADNWRDLRVFIEQNL